MKRDKPVAYRLRLALAKMRRRMDLLILRRRLAWLIEETSRQLRMTWMQEKLEEQMRNQQDQAELENTKLQLNKMMLSYRLPLNSRYQQELMVNLQLACQDLIMELQRDN